MNKMMKRRRLLFGGAFLPEFYITQSGKTYEFYFEEGMSWNSFVQSDFNDGSFSINGTSVLFKNGNVTGETSYKTIVAEKTYESVAKLIVFESGKRALSAGSIVTSASENYSFTSSAIKIGAGEAGKVSIQGIDFSKYSKLNITAYLNVSGDASEEFYYVGYGDTKSTAEQHHNMVKKGVPKTKTTLTFNISSVSTQKYIYLNCWASGGVYVEVYDIWLE